MGMKATWAEAAIGVARAVASLKVMAVRGTTVIWAEAAIGARADNEVAAIQMKKVMVE